MACNDRVRICVDEDKFHLLSYAELEKKLDELNSDYMAHTGLATKQQLKRGITINKIKKYLNTLDFEKVEMRSK